MRDFNDADRKKKSGRIQLPDNPGNLSEETRARLRAAVEGAAQEGAVSCPAAWRLAKDEGVSRLDVGVTIDSLGIRVVDCQLGCFAVEKTALRAAEPPPADDEVGRRVEALSASGHLTCPNLFALARELHVVPAVVSDAANRLGRKLRGCQLGCF